MNINIQTIPHNQQRYETVGDWWFDDKDNIEIRVSDMGNPQYEFLVAYHEQCEVMMCLNEGITEEEVSAFDIEFEKNRPEDNTDEPGDDPKAPYRKQHFAATTLERQMAANLDVDWKTYDDAVNSLQYVRYYH